MLFRLTERATGEMLLTKQEVVEDGVVEKAQDVTGHEETAVLVAPRKPGAKIISLFSTVDQREIDPADPEQTMEELKRDALLGKTVRMIIRLALVEIGESNDNDSGERIET